MTRANPVFLLALLLAVSTARGQAAPAPGADTCVPPASEERIVREQEAADRQRVEAQLAPAYRKTLESHLEHALSALEAAQLRAREEWAYREARRATDACLAKAQPDPFCEGIVRDDLATCALVPTRPGPILPESCRALASMRAAVRAGAPDRCGALGDIAPLCRMLVAGGLRCDGLDGEIPVELCHLVLEPERCASPEGKERERCALAAMVQAIRGDRDACARIPLDGYERLAATCRAMLAEDVTLCLPSAKANAPALARCVTPQPWPPTFERRAASVQLRAAVANVLTVPADCQIEVSVVGGPSSVPIAPVPIETIPPGQARFVERELPLASVPGEARGEVRCTWQTEKAGIVTEVKPFGGPSIGYPVKPEGDGVTPPAPRP